ncbi:MAG: DUF1559 domain-containing protein [Planctomycetaceae bacterium]|jgi:hypothetical protein|nr:DUF1559 domain-containing protein [Planctomycetaceae bacterium]
MKTFFLTILFAYAISVSGCADKINSETQILNSPNGNVNTDPNQSVNNLPNPTNTNQNNSPRLQAAPPTNEMLNSLSPTENDFDTRWFLHDSYYVLTGQPKKFFNTEVGKNSEEVLTNLLNTIFQIPFQIDYSKIERFTLAAAPQGIFTLDAPAQNGTITKRQSLALRRTIIFNLTEPIAKTMIQTICNSQSNQSLESIKKQIAKIEYYNLLPPKIPTDQIRAGIFAPNDNTVVIFIMLTDDANKLLAEKNSTDSAAVKRLKRLDTNSNILTLSASWEGINADPQRLIEIPFVGTIVSYLGETNAQQFVQNFRAINLTVKPDAQVKKPMLSIRYDAINDEGATKIHEIFLGIHITAQTTFAAMKDETMASLPLSKDTTINLLKSIEIEKTEDSAGFYFRINKFDGFDKTIKDGIAEMSTRLQKEKILINKVEQLKNLADVSIQYDKLNKKFPQPIRNDDGKPILSWRIAILPLIGQQELYNKFNLKEPWDSPTNIKLLENIPAAFIPIDNNIDKGKTQIQRFTSPETPLADTELTIEKIKQPFHTLLLIQTAPENAIEWTKPDELIFDENNLNKIFGDTIIGISFSSVPIVQNFLPPNNQQSQLQRTLLTALIKDKPLPPPLNQNQINNHNHDGHDHDGHEHHDHDGHDHHDHDHHGHDHNHEGHNHEGHDHNHDHGSSNSPPPSVTLPIIMPKN